MLSAVGFYGEVVVTPLSVVIGQGARFPVPTPGPLLSSSATEQARNATEQTPNAAEQARNATEQTPNATEQARNATEQTPNAAEQTPNATEQTPNAAEQTPNATEQTPNAAEQTPNAAEQTPNAAEQARNATEQTPNAAEQTPNAAEQARNATEQTPNAAEQTPNAAEQGLNATEQTLNATEQTPNATEQARNATEHTPNATEQARNATEQTPNATEQARNATEHTPNATEQARNATEQARNATEQGLDATEPGLDATEQTPNATEQTPGPIRVLPSGPAVRRWLTAGPAIGQVVTTSHGSNGSIPNNTIRTERGRSQWLKTYSMPRLMFGVWWVVVSGKFFVEVATLKMPDPLICGIISAIAIVILIAYSLSSRLLKHLARSILTRKPTGPVSGVDSPVFDVFVPEYIRGVVRIFIAWFIAIICAYLGHLPVYIGIPLSSTLLPILWVITIVLSLNARVKQRVDLYNVSARVAPLDRVSIVGMILSPVLISMLACCFCLLPLMLLEVALRLAHYMSTVVGDSLQDFFMRAHPDCDPGIETLVRDLCARYNLCSFGARGERVIYSSISHETRESFVTSRRGGDPPPRYSAQRMTSCSFLGAPQPYSARRVPSSAFRGAPPPYSESESSPVELGAGSLASYSNDSPPSYDEVTSASSGENPPLVPPERPVSPDNASDLRVADGAVATSGSVVGSESGNVQSSHLVQVHTMPASGVHTRTIDN